MANSVLLRVNQTLCSFFKKNSSLIMSIGCAAGVVATGVSSATATFRAQKKLADAALEREEPLTKKEAVALAIPSYILPASIAVATIGCILANYHFTHQEKMALIATCTLATGKLKEFKEQTDAIFGEGAAEKVEQAITEDRLARHADVRTDDHTELFYDTLSGRMFESTKEAVMAAEYHLNRNFALRGYAPLNEFYDFLGIPTTKEGSVLGWSIDCFEFYGYYWIDFDHEKMTTDDGLECYAITMPFAPTADYLNEF